MRRPLLLATALLFVAACGSERSAPPTPASSSRLQITVAPLGLADIGDADYTVQIYAGAPDAGGQLVAEAAHLTSSRYGDGAGSLTYVAPCDASAGTNHVRLILHGLWDAGGEPVDPQTWVNPTPVTQPAPCVADTDTPVTFKLTLLRDASQGFFDVAVTFEDIFCSAKFDCVGDDGQPIELLHDGDAGRSTTMVLAFACASGDGEPTWLQMSDVYVACDEGGQQSVHWLAPAGDGGNMGAVNPVFFQTALYAGDEQLPNVDKCYWNLALGLDADAPANCTLVVDATASAASWAADGRSPDGTVYPYVHYEIPFTDAEGGLACGRHALDGDDGRVTTGYTEPVGAAFPFERRCGGPPDDPIVEAPRVSCDADVQGLGATSAVFSESPSGVSVAFDGIRSDSYALPDGLMLDGCCLNPCCTQ